MENTAKKKRSSKKAKSFKCAINCHVLKTADDSEYACIVDDKDNPERKKTFRRYTQEGMHDTRYNFYSIENNLNSLEFYYNYMDFVSEGAYSAVKQTPLVGNASLNPLMKKYLEYGFMPVIHLPSFAINRWTQTLVPWLDLIGAEYITIPSVPVWGSARLNSYDYLMTREEIIKALKKTVPVIVKEREQKIAQCQDEEMRTELQELNEEDLAFLSGPYCKPEKLRLTNVIRRLYG